MDRIVEKQKKLMHRLEMNFADYEASILKLNKQNIFDKAAEIAAVKRVSYYMTNIHGYYESDLDYLLKFQNPLKLVSDRYQFNTRAYLHDVVARLCDTQDHAGDYFYMLDPKAKVSGR